MNETGGFNMSSIEELQHRVVEAEERFGLINAERAKYSERLMGLIDAIETRLGDQQSEIKRQAEEAVSQAEEMVTLRRDSDENKLLRGMLQSLLNAIELGNNVALNETMQVLDTKISALIGEAGETEAATSETEAPVIETADTLEEESAAPDLETAEAADPEPEVETVEAEIETVEAEMETAEAVVTEVEVAEVATSQEDGSNPPEEECAVEEPEAAPEPEHTPEAIADVADEQVTAEEAPLEAQAEEANLEVQAETETGAPEILEIPDSDADVTMIDEEMVIGAASGDAPAADGALEENDDALEEHDDTLEENLVDEADVAQEIPAADDDEQQMEASSLEDIMRRVSKLVEDEGALGSLAGGGEIDESAPSPEAESLEPAEVQKTASGG